MGISIGPKIVTDGLVLCLDAGDLNSYPGSGTNWYDLSGNGNDGNINGATYQSTNKGTFEFDGINDVVSFGAATTFFPLYNFTIEIWFSSFGTTPTTGTQPSLIGLTYGIRILIRSTYISYGLDNGTSFTYINSPSTYSFYDSSWHQVVIQATSDTRQLYIDSKFVSELSDNWTGTTRWPTTIANLGRDNNDYIYFFRGYIPIYKIYNKILTTQEITQNFNAQKSRFRL